MIGKCYARNFHMPEKNACETQSHGTRVAEAHIDWSGQSSVSQYKPFSPHLPLPDYDTNDCIVIVYYEEKNDPAPPKGQLTILYSSFHSCCCRKLEWLILEYLAHDFCFIINQ